MTHSTVFYLKISVQTLLLGGFYVFSLRLGARIGSQDVMDLRRGKKATDHVPGQSVLFQFTNGTTHNSGLDIFSSRLGHNSKGLKKRALGAASSLWHKVMVHEARK